MKKTLTLLTLATALVGGTLLSYPTPVAAQTTTNNFDPFDDPFFADTLGDGATTNTGGTGFQEDNFTYPTMTNPWEYVLPSLRPH
jgi:hypothetical protein